MKRVEVPYKEIYGAKWIAHKNCSPYVAEFKKEFHLCEKIKSAELIVCGLGFFDCFVNNGKTDKFYYKPIVADYTTRDWKREPKIVDGASKSTYFCKYDVASLLHCGKNELRIYVANGYYQNDDRPEEPFYASYGDKKLIFTLSVCFGDGTERRIVSDKQTLVRETNMCSGLYAGDFIDFSAKENEFASAKETDAPDGKYFFCSCPLDTVDKKISPVNIRETCDGILYDFGVNHSGGLEFVAHGTKGQKVTCKYAEVLYDDGQPNFETGRFEEYDTKTGELLRRIDQSSEYVLSGGYDKIAPLYSWHCYRYALISGAGGAEIRNLFSLYIHSDIKETGEFSCSEPIFNDIAEKTLRTIYDNLHAGLLTDCPHREKRPYTGDGGVMCESLLYMLDAESYLSKWLDDLIGAQDKDGFVPYTAPHLGGGGGYAWSSAIVTAMETLYRYTGDCEYLSRASEAVGRFVHFLLSRSRDYIVSGIGEKGEWLLGDWLAPQSTEFNVSYMGTLCLYKAATAAEKAARILGDGEKAKRYEQIKDNVEKAINGTFYDASTSNYCDGTQGQNAFALQYGIVSQEHKTAVKKSLEKFYAAKRHFDTGMIATPILIETLFENGMADIAYEMLTQTDYPSYADMLDGESTLSEHWSRRWPDYKRGENGETVKGGGHVSHCHPMFGSVTASLYKHAAGLDASRICDGKIVFAPKCLRFMKSAKAKIETRHGVAETQWSTENGFYMRVTIPNGLNGQFAFAYPWAEEMKVRNGGIIKKSADGCFRFELPCGKWSIEQNFRRSKK